MTLHSHRISISIELRWLNQTNSLLIRRWLHNLLSQDNAWCSVEDFKIFTDLNNTGKHRHNDRFFRLNCYFTGNSWDDSHATHLAFNAYNVGAAILRTWDGSYWNYFRQCCHDTRIFSCKAIFWKKFILNNLFNTTDNI